MHDIEYADMHRVFLQGMMSRGVLDFKEVNELLLASVDYNDLYLPSGKDEKRELLQSIISAINDKINDLNLAIRKGVDEDNGSNFFILVNLSKRSLELGRSQIEYNSEELSYIELLTQEILKTEEKFISSKKALNLCRDAEFENGKEITMNQADDCIHKLLEGKWLKDVYGGKLALGVRFLVEMDAYIREYLDDECANCPICSKVVSRGCRCDNCDVIFHRHCAQKMLKAKGGDGEFRCTQCKAVVVPEIQVDTRLIAEQGPMTPGPSSKEIGERIKRGLEEADREMSDADEDSRSQVTDNSSQQSQNEEEDMEAESSS